MDSRDPKVRVISFISGFTAGIIRTLVGHPFDTLKVLVQTSMSTQRRLKTGAHTQNTPSSLSIKRLYRGIGPPLLSMGVVTSLNFSIYENTRLTALSYLEPRPDQSLQHAAIIFGSATFAGSILVLMTSPLDNLKVLQQVYPKDNAAGSFYWLRKLWKEGNPYRGLTSNLVCAGIGRGFYLLGYTSTLNGFEHYSPGSPDNLLVKLTAASVAGISGWLMVFPFDVVRSNMMADHKKQTFSSTASCFRSLYLRGGVRALYSGLGYTLVRAVPVACAALVTYDYLQGFFLRQSRQAHSQQQLGQKTCE